MMPRNVFRLPFRWLLAISAQLENEKRDDKTKQLLYRDKTRVEKDEIHQKIFKFLDQFKGFIERVLRGW